MFLFSKAAFNYTSASELSGEQYLHRQRRHNNRVVPDLSRGASFVDYFSHSCKYC